MTKPRLQLKTLMFSKLMDELESTEILALDDNYNEDLGALVVDLGEWNAKHAEQRIFLYARDPTQYTLVAASDFVVGTGRDGELNALMDLLSPYFANGLHDRPRLEAYLQELGYA